MVGAADRSDMDRIEYLAEISVRRGCGFGALAIVTAMVGMVGDPVLCLKAGALMTTLMGAILAGRAAAAPRRDSRRTEVWLMLDSGRDLPPGYPPQIIGEVLKETYVRYAELSGIVALALWAATAFATATL